MTSRLSQKATSILAALGIVLLLAFLIFLWTGVQHGLFKTGHAHRKTVDDVDRNATEYAATSAAAADERRFVVDDGDGGRAKTLLPTEKIGIGKEVQYVKPIKISPLPLHEHDIIYDQSRHGDKEVKPQMKYHSGHFRHHKAPLWDPHPQYTINAFGKSLHLALVHDSKFVSPNLQTSHIWANDTSRRTKPGIQTDGCFYSGRVKGDEHSRVAVSLCNGMTGYIRTDGETYYIEPVEHFNATRPILHAIHREQRTNSHKPCATLTDDQPDEVNGNDLPQYDDNAIPHDRTKRATANLKLKSERILSAPPAALYRYTNYGPDDQSRYEIRSRYTNLDRNRYDSADVAARSSNGFRYDDDVDDAISVESASREDLKHGPIGVENRRKREDDQEYYIELMIVADQSMLDTHKTEDNLYHYILTLISHVSLLFKDPTIGNPITISVTGIHTMGRIFDKKKNPDSLKQRLVDFCEWQKEKKFNHRYDVAMFMTRLNICSGECNALGIANINAMCNKNESCSVVRDKGLSTSVTIAHELGHLLNMPHDQDGRCKKRQVSHHVNNIMTQEMDNETVPWIWSKCSRHYITEFLDSPKSQCLTNVPSVDMLSEQEETDVRLPGEIFTRQHQCELTFGHGWTVCNFDAFGTSDMYSKSCGLLSCLKLSDGSCHTPFMMWAEGTECGDRKWCHRGKCIPSDAQILTPVMGGWGEYQPWSECSLTCGGGIQWSRRECDNPRPKHGGKYCAGRPVRYKLCNTHECPVAYTVDGYPYIHDVREEQCAKWNGNNRGILGVPHNVRWVPKYGVSAGHECQLFCRIEHSSANYQMETKVIDGAKCQLDGYDVCVNGVCMQAGCDNRLGSNVTLDKCGVCGGDGTQCTTVEGSITHRTIYGYNRVIRIPKGSRSIHIQQHGRNGSKEDNYLVLVDSESGRYLLNGNNTLERQKIVVYGGIEIEYSGSTSVEERLNSSSRRPLQKDLIVEVMTVTVKKQPNVTYSYTVPTDSHVRYAWKVTANWTQCSDICEGRRARRTVCVQSETLFEVPPAHCSHLPEPDTEAEDCNMFCQLRWKVTSREECSAHCGNGVRRVHYHCVQIMVERGMKTTIHRAHCANIPEAPQTEPCVGPCDQTVWKYGPWSACSVTCGSGQQTRNATCVSKDNLTVDPSHCVGQEQHAMKPCELNKCPEWAIDKWSPCSVTCGRGFQQRLYYCHVNMNLVKKEMCDETKRPKLMTACEEKPCPKWYASEWTKCSVTCENGYVKRDVHCRNWNGNRIANDKCDEATRPEAVQYCELAACPTKKYTHAPKFVAPTPRSAHIDNNSISVQQHNEKDYTWRSKSWSECTRTCGVGIKFRSVFCVDENGAPAEGLCNEKVKPLSKVDCNKDPCPTWQSAGWSKCDSNCYKNRQVRCQSHRGESLPDARCSIDDRPTHAQLCTRKECTLSQHNDSLEPRATDARPARRYQWFMSSWSPCSKTCDSGTRQRTVHCVDSVHKQSQPDQFCSHIKKRPTTKTCFKGPCPGIRWIAGPWSNCSAQCDSGTQTRSVACNRVKKNGQVDLIDDRHCEKIGRPATTQPCSVRRCDDKFYWHAGPWQSCSPACGKKRKQERHLYCHQRGGKKVHKHYCPQELKPARRRKCPLEICRPFSSCRDAKYLSGSRSDREYLLSVRGRNVSIFCRGMATDSPREYLTLHADNFAEYYDKRLRDPNTCPNNGRRPDAQCRECVDSDGGYTVFKRVRLDVDTLQVITNDFTYTSQLKGDRIPYGTAGDCYSSVPRCPQGQFEINLHNTGFRVSHLTEWTNSHDRSSSDIRRKSPVRIFGRCGGQCGHCEPNPLHGLILEVT